ncbi:thioredoxin fold domain-containing protein [Ichthyenterobacterium sp. W332]|uniref:Thioredoxin fold domain-containing protein n=1 Tax=Microcosmobacter mediterraneus TaxID=3075607 RepID=A0ABU2YJZ6_9FLAO|nr:thioredoxin fold domain-containing protein [Ichthyenterobacterium sp. W332]MDT0558485.1 thioredoxin fold domain-containing protein [Ichthyenterobacterium sp. W332]
MKKLILLLLVVGYSTISSAQDKINWVSLEEALELQKKSPKKIMIDVYTVWCGPCKMLDKNTFQNQDVADFVNKNYYAVKFNAQGNSTINYQGKTFSNPGYDPAKAQRRNATHELARAFKVQAFPTIVFLDEESNFITPLRGYQKPQQLELYLKLFKDDDYKNMKSQEDFNTYYTAFKPTFKG